MIIYENFLYYFEVYQTNEQIVVGNNITKKIHKIRCNIYGLFKEGPDIYRSATKMTWSVAIGLFFHSVRNQL